MVGSTALQKVHKPQETRMLDYKIKLGLFSSRRSKLPEPIPESYKSSEKGVEAIERVEKEIQREDSFEVRKCGVVDCRAGVIAGA
ncbi:hypothetical protein Tco_0115013 [Tanacetum coccineum]